jgi:hypothetical protein
MSARRAIIRLWFFGSLFWMAFWAWNYGTKCMRARNGSLWCPTTSGASVSLTNYFHVAWVALGPPVSTFIVGVLCLWVLNKASQRRTTTN